MPECKICKGTGAINDAAPWVMCVVCDGYGRVSEEDMPRVVAELEAQGLKVIVHPRPVNNPKK
jgi:RecJ-like exonuclease